MHCIQALVAPRHVFANLQQTVPSAMVRQLPQDFCLVPITEEFVADLSTAGWAVGDPTNMPAQEMEPGVCAIAADASFRGPVVFIATYIHGGTGGQDAVVWKQGKILASFHEDEDSMSAWPDSSISRALREVGVLARPGEDEFDAIGLGTHRSTSGWAESTAVVFPASLPLKGNITIPFSEVQRPWWKFWK